MSANKLLKPCLLLPCMLLLFGCASSMKMSPAELKNVSPNEGVVIGSLIIRGGDDLLGRTEWNLNAKNDNDKDFFPKHYAVNAHRDGKEEIFAIKMPAGDATFFSLSQPGFSSFNAKTNISFKVQANKNTYIGKIIVEFPSGYIAVNTKYRYKIIDEKNSIVERANDLYGIDLTIAPTSLAY